LQLKRKSLCHDTPVKQVKEKAKSKLFFLADVTIVD
jgi:hypothetical protein